jgi:hypothetical protein
MHEPLRVQLRIVDHDLALGIVHQEHRGVRDELVLALHLNRDLHRGREAHDGGEHDAPVRAGGDEALYAELPLAITEDGAYRADDGGAQGGRGEGGAGGDREARDCWDVRAGAGGDGGVVGGQPGQLAFVFVQIGNDQRFRCGDERADGMWGGGGGSTGGTFHLQVRVAAVRENTERDGE